MSFEVVKTLCGLATVELGLLKTVMMKMYLEKK